MPVAAEIFEPDEIAFPITAGRHFVLDDLAFLVPDEDVICGALSLFPAMTGAVSCFPVMTGSVEVERC